MCWWVWGDGWKTHVPKTKITGIHFPYMSALKRAVENQPMLSEETAEDIYIYCRTALSARPTKSETAKLHSDEVQTHPSARTK